MGGGEQSLRPRFTSVPCHGSCLTFLQTPVQHRDKGHPRDYVLLQHDLEVGEDL